MLAAKYDAGKKLLLDSKVGEVTEVSGNLTAEVDGTDKYSVKVTLHGNGQWSNSCCSCPDGVRTDGKV